MCASLRVEHVVDHRAHVHRACHVQVLHVRKSKVFREAGSTILRPVGVEDLFTLSLMLIFKSEGHKRIRDPTVLNNAGDRSISVDRELLLRDLILVMSLLLFWRIKSSSQKIGRWNTVVAALSFWNALHEA